MKRIFLSLFLLITMQTYGMDRVPDDEASAPKVSASREFLVDIKRAASCIGCYTPLRAIEDGICSILPDSARYSNILARIKFKEGLLAKRLRTNPNRVISALSINDIDHLNKHLLLIQLNVLSIGDHQGLRPLGRRAPKLGMALDESATDQYVVRRTLYSPSEEDPQVDFKKELLIDSLDLFEGRIGALLSVISVKKLSMQDRASVEQIDNSLDALRPLFQNVDVP